MNQHELIAMLGEVADVVSSASGVEAVLEGIVERARRITDTEKAIVVLTDPQGVRLDLGTIVVRGQRAVHLQQWWQDRLEELGDAVFEPETVVVERHPEHDAWLLRSPVRFKDRPVGVLVAINSGERPFSQAQLDFIAVLASFVGAAVENARLAEEGRYALLASERSRVAGEIHDGVLQSLFAVSVGLEVSRRLVASDAERAVDQLERLQHQLEGAMAELRRVVHDLRPAELAERGLSGAIEYWIDEITAGRQVRGRLIVDGTIPILSPAQEACLHRVAKESVSNVVRHAAADWFEVRLTPCKDIVRLTVADNGCGFDPGRESGDRPDGGVGLRSMRQRVQREGGELSIVSSPDTGTTITVDLPRTVS
jgi:signal transduction histidine kinase